MYRIQFCQPGGLKLVSSDTFLQRAIRGNVGGSTSRQHRADCGCSDSCTLSPFLWVPPTPLFQYPRRVLTGAARNPEDGRESCRSGTEEEAGGSRNQRDQIEG